MIDGVCVKATTLVGTEGQFVGVGSVVSPVGSWDKIQVGRHTYLETRDKCPSPLSCLSPMKSIYIQKIILLLFFVCVFHLHVCMCVTIVMWPWRSQEGAGSLRTGVTDSCEPPCGC